MRLLLAAAVTLVLACDYAPAPPAGGHHEGRVAAIAAGSCDDERSAALRADAGCAGRDALAPDASVHVTVNERGTDDAGIARYGVALSYSAPDLPADALTFTFNYEPNFGTLSNADVFTAASADGGTRVSAAANGALNGSRGLLCLTRRLEDAAGACSDDFEVRW